ncbi:MAG: flippase [Candidatus Paceibacteria bacterium]
MVDSDDAFERVVQGSIFIFIGNSLGAASAFLTRLFAARYLGPADYGLIVLGVTLLNISSIIALLGLPDGVARQLPRSKNKNKLFFSALSLALPVAVLISLLMITFAKEIAAVLQEPNFSPILILFAFGIPFLTFIRLTVGGMRGLESARGRIAIQNLGYQGLTAVGVIIGVFLGFGTYEIAGSWITALLISTVVGGYLLSKKLTIVPELSPTFRRGKMVSYLNRTRSLLLFSLPLLLSRGLQVLLQQSDNFLLGFFLHSNVVGIYDAAFTVGKLLLLFIDSAVFLFLPLFSDLHSKEQWGQMDRIYELTAKWLVFITLPIYLIVVFFPDQILTFVFGSAYARGDTALVIIASGFFVHVILGTNGTGLIATGYTRKILWGNVMGFTLNIGLNIALIPRIGIIGAAIASAFGYGISNIYWMHQLYSQTGIQPFSKPYLYIVTGSTVGFLLLFTLTRILGESGTTAMGLLTVLYFVLHIVLIGLVGIESEETKWISEHLPKVD